MTPLLPTAYLTKPGQLTIVAQAIQNQGNFGSPAPTVTNLHRFSPQQIIECLVKEIQAKKDH